MPDKPDYIRITVCPTGPPPPQVRAIRSEIVHSMPAVELFGLDAFRFIRSDLSSSMPAVEIFDLQELQFIRSDLVHSMPAVEIFGLDALRFIGLQLQGTLEAPMFKRVQHGVITIGAAEDTHDATIEAVDLTKSILFLLGQNGGGTWACDVLCRLSMVNATTVRATRLDHTEGVAAVLAFLVLEFNAWIKSLNRGTITIADGASSGDATITSIDTTKGLLSFLGSNHDASAFFSSLLICRIRLLNTTTIRAERVSTGAAATVGYELLEFS